MTFVIKVSHCINYSRWQKQKPNQKNQFFINLKDIVFIYFNPASLWMNRINFVCRKVFCPNTSEKWIFHPFSSSSPNGTHLSAFFDSSLSPWYCPIIICPRLSTHWTPFVSASRLSVSSCQVKRQLENWTGIMLQVQMVSAQSPEGLHGPLMWDSAAPLQPWTEPEGSTAVEDILHWSNF